jgi:hypothetical protein
MRLRSSIILVKKWYLTLPGLLLSLVAASMAFTLVPSTYSSTGVAVLVQSQTPRPGGTNPLVNFDPSLTTTTSIMVQVLNSPALLPAVSGLPGSSFSVKNMGDASANNASVQPFIYFYAQSRSAVDSTSMISRLMDLARRDLIDRQRSLLVRPNKYLSLTNVVEATGPKYVVGSQIAATGVAFMTGMMATIALTLLWARYVDARRHTPRVQPRGSHSPLATDNMPADPFDVSSLPVNGATANVNGRPGGLRW